MGKVPTSAWRPTRCTPAISVQGCEWSDSRRAWKKKEWKRTVRETFQAEEARDTREEVSSVIVRVETDQIAVENPEKDFSSDGKSTTENNHKV